MRRSLIFVAAALGLALGGCEPTKPKPTPTPTPTSALYPRPTCTGATVTPAHKRICANKSLDWLDRSLQKQWEAARKGAGPDKLKELDDTQAKFLAARDACADDMCVAKLYKSYLTPTAKPVPPKKPWVKKPVAKPVAKPPVKKPTKWHPKPKPTPAPSRWERSRGPSCVSTAGAAMAQQLARQCSRVNPGSCSPDRSCGSLRGAIRRGCNATYRKPGFCARY